MRYATRVLFCALLLLAFASTAPAQTALLGDGVVVDTERATAYTMNLSGGIDAVDLASGNTLWTSDVAARPIAMTDRGLLAQAQPSAAGELALRVIDPTGVAVASHAVALRGGVWATVQDSNKVSFRISAVPGDGAVSLNWTSSVSNLEGALQSPEDGLAPGDLVPDTRANGFTRQEGSLELDLASGAISNAIATRNATPVALSEGQFVTTREAGRQFLSADGQHVMVSKLVSLIEGYQWTIYTRGGERLGELQHRFSAAPFVVIDGTIVFRSEPFGARIGDEIVEELLAVRGVALGTGASLFTRNIGTAQFQGEYAP
ncbi:MAG: hypothetical protein AAGD38_13475 [Acidobacteriota bacterium]